ncbi:MAG: hypothetical protein IJ529_02580 [Alphaproteobacteria bacterium]|nr:hypothetical protein [Alphaproteobacteria bacterium]
MHKYILMLGVAGVALGSYAAYAGNSATMTVTATIAHDVSLNVTHALEFGSIVVDPSQSNGWFTVNADETVNKSGGIISVTGISLGTFTANVPDSCKVNGQIDDNTHPCFSTETSRLIMGGIAFNDPIVYYDSDNKFKLGLDSVDIFTATTPGDYSSILTITYTAP